MQAVLVDESNKNNAEALYIGQAERPKLKEDELLIKIKAFGLNRMASGAMHRVPSLSRGAIQDIMQRMGKYPVPPGTSPIVCCLNTPT